METYTVLEPLQLNKEAHLVEQLDAEEIQENVYEDEDSETDTSEDTSKLILHFILFWAGSWGEEDR